jgi:hypothetical protein
MQDNFQLLYHYNAFDVGNIGIAVSHIQKVPLLSMPMLMNGQYVIAAFVGSVVSDHMSD